MPRRRSIDGNVNFVINQAGCEVVCGRVCLPFSKSDGAFGYTCESTLQHVFFRLKSTIAYLCVLHLGVPMPKLEWYKDAVPLSKLNNTRYKLTSSSMVLQVRKVQPDDAGIFQCFAENTAGQIQAFTNLVVTSKMTFQRPVNVPYSMQNSKSGVNKASICASLNIHCW